MRVSVSKRDMGRLPRQVLTEAEFLQVLTQLTEKAVAWSIDAAVDGQFHIRPEEMYWDSTLQSQPDAAIVADIAEAGRGRVRAHFSDYSALILNLSDRQYFILATHANSVAQQRIDESRRIFDRPRAYWRRFGQVGPRLITGLLLILSVGVFIRVVASTASIGWLIASAICIFILEIVFFRIVNRTTMISDRFLPKKFPGLTSGPVDLTTVIVQVSGIVLTAIATALITLYLSKK